MAANLNTFFKEKKTQKLKLNLVFDVENTFLRCGSLCSELNIKSLEKRAYDVLAQIVGTHLPGNNAPYDLTEMVSGYSPLFKFELHPAQKILYDTQNKVIDGVEFVTEKYLIVIKIDVENKTFLTPETISQAIQSKFTAYEGRCTAEVIESEQVDATEVTPTRRLRKSKSLTAEEWEATMKKPL